MRQLRATLLLLAWSASIGASLYVLSLLGGSAYPTPPFESTNDLLAWTQHTQPLVAAGSIVRLAALAAGWYLLATTALGLTARALGLRRTVVLADHLTLPVVRRLVSRVVGAGLVAQIGLLGATPALAAPEPAVPASTAAPLPTPLAVMRALPEPTPTTTMRALAEPTATTTMRALPEPTATTTMRALPEPTPTTTMRALPDPAPTTTTMRALPDPSGPSPASRPPDDDTSGWSAHTWTVRPGDHLWRVAEVVVALHRGAAPTEQDTGAYLDRLVAENRERLPNAADPDLILPGQVLVLPPVEP